MTPEERYTVIEAQLKAFEDFCRHAFGSGEQHRIYGTGYMFWQAAWQAATLAERERCATLSPNGLDVLASDSPAVVWQKYSAAIRKG